MSKRIGNIKRLLVAMGISFLGVCTLNQMAAAAPAGVVKHYRTQGLEDVVRYEIELTETTAGDADQYHLDKLYYMDEDGESKIDATITAGSIEGEISNTNGGGKKETANVVVEVPATVDKLIIENNKNETAETAETATITLWTEEGEPAVKTYTGVLDNDAPVIDWAYKNVEGNYIQFKASDAGVIVDRILDQNEKDRVIIQEKDKEQEVIAKYKLKDGDETFYVVDRLGNSAEVDISSIKVEYTLAAKDIEGSTVVLNMKLPEGATFTNITTVDDIDITVASNATADFRKTGDNLVAIYTGVPVGTTYVNVNYTEDDTPKTIPVELDLDLTSPEVVHRDVVGQGGIVQTGGSLRAYKNYDSTMAIVEVKDMVSGITKIAAATENTDAAESKVVVDEELDPTPTNEAFRIEGLPTSVVQLIKLPEGATHIRVHDGIDNVKSIDLADVPVVYGNTTEDGEAGVELTLTPDGNDVHAVYRSSKAGLKKFVKVTQDGAKQARAIAVVLDKKAENETQSPLESTIDNVINEIFTAAKTAADIAESEHAQDITDAEAVGPEAVAAKKQEVRSEAVEAIISGSMEQAKGTIKTSLTEKIGACTQAEKADSSEEDIVSRIDADKKAAIIEALTKLITYKIENGVINTLKTTVVNDSETTSLTDEQKADGFITAEQVRITVEEVDAVIKKVGDTEKTSHGDREYLIGKTANGTESIYLPIQTTSDIATYYPVTEQNTDIGGQTLITISGKQLQIVPEYVAVDVFGNTKLFNLNDILFKAGLTEDDTDHYIYINADVSEDNKTTAISLKVQDIRRVKKITATIDGVEKTLETFQIDDPSNIKENGVSTQDVDRVYEIKKGNVSKVTVYHWNVAGDKNKHLNGITQNEVTIEPKNIVRSDSVEGVNDRADLVKINKDEDNKYNVDVKYGVKRIDYSDNTVLEFYDEIPKNVEIICEDASNHVLSVVVTDALGYEYVLNEDGNNEAINTYGPQQNTEPSAPQQDPEPSNP